MDTAAGRRRLRLLRTIVLGVVAGVVLLELALRVAGWAAERRGATLRSAPVEDGRPTFLFAGDSTIFGLYCAPEETSAAQAEALAAKVAAPGFRAVNRGRPGFPSWAVLDDLRIRIERERPRVVVVRAGAMNPTFVHPDRMGWLGDLRIVRVMRLLMKATTKGWETSRDGGAVPFLATPAPPKEYAAHDLILAELGRDLAAIADLVRRSGAELYFLAYLHDNGFNGKVNVELAKAGRCIDASTLAKRARYRSGRTDLFYLDGHPTPLAYGLEARLLVKEWIAAGILSGADPGDPLQWIESEAPPRPVLELTGEELVVRGEPRAEGLLVIGRAGISEFAPGLDVPLDLSPFPLASGKGTGERFFLPFDMDARGTARVPLTDSMRRGLPRAPRAVAAVLRRSANREAMSYSISDALDFELPREPEVSAGR